MNKKSKYDKLLWAELGKENPREEATREAVAKGANIKGDFLIAAIMQFIPQPDLEVKQQFLDIRFIKLLIELGADINFIDTDGYNCLYAAGMTWNPALVELILKEGANPNCIAHEDGQSLLDWFHQDQYYEANINLIDRGGGEPLAKIVEILKRYGAKYSNELQSK